MYSLIWLVDWGPWRNYVTNSMPCYFTSAYRLDSDIFLQHSPRMHFVFYNMVDSSMSKQQFNKGSHVPLILHSSKHLISVYWINKGLTHLRRWSQMASSHSCQKYSGYWTGLWKRVAAAQWSSAILTMWKRNGEFSLRKIQGGREGSGPSQGKASLPESCESVSVIFSLSPIRNLTYHWHHISEQSTSSDVCIL